MAGPAARTAADLDFLLESAKVVERLNLGYTHERRYTGASVRALLERHGFRVVRVQRAGLLPHLATGLSPRGRGRYYAVSSWLFTVDRVLSRTPILNRLAQSLEIVAEHVVRER